VHFTPDWILKRCAVSLFVVYAYFGFWHVQPRAK
jgi:hypothetical protein